MKTSMLPPSSLGFVVSDPEADGGPEGARESCDPEEPEQAADISAHSVLLLLRPERQESCMNLRYLAVPTAPLHQTASLVMLLLRVPAMGRVCTFSLSQAGLAQHVLI